MKNEDIKITSGQNEFQNASFECNDKTLDYETSCQLSFNDIVSITRGLDIVSEFFDVNAIVTIDSNTIGAVALGKSLEEALVKAMDSNPHDFINSVICVSAEVDSDFAKLLKPSNKIVAPKFTKNTLEVLERHNVGYVQINTPLKEYKNYISNDMRITPMGTIIQTPNISDLNKDTFKVVTKAKPTVEQIEDAVFAWKVAKHVNSKAVVVAKDLGTVAISQGLQSLAVEFALDNACDRAKDAILACDSPLTVHDINVAAQERIAFIIQPFASKEIIDLANKYNISMITTGMTNVLY